MIRGKILWLAMGLATVAVVATAGFARAGGGGGPTSGTITLHQATASAGADCPDTTNAYWHFVLSPNKGMSFGDITLNIGGTLMTFHVPADLAHPVAADEWIPNSGPGGFQTDNVFVQVPSGSTLSDLRVSDSSGSSTAQWNSETGTTPNLFNLSHVCTGGGGGGFNDDLTVSKTAVPSFKRTFSWEIDKSADTDTVYSAGGGESGAVNYKVDVTKTTTDSDFVVSGAITVENPTPSAVTVALSDGSCVITPASVSVPANGSADATYACPSSATNPGSGTNTVTATWDKVAANTENGSATGSADWSFAGVDPTTAGDDSITVSDPNAPDAPWSFSDSGEKTYSKTYTDPTTGTCTSHENTATIDQTGQTDSVTVKDCQGADLTVSKTATPSFKRTFSWTIDKSADTDTVYSAGGGESGAVNYKVDVTKTSTDSDFVVSGKITVSNPNDWEDITADVTDDLPGGTCSVTGGTSVVVPASGSKDVSYSCTFASNPGTGTNTGTATWDKDAAHTPTGTASGSKDFTFGAPTSTDGYDSITVSDPNAPDAPWPFSGDGEKTYSKTYTDKAGTCTSHENTATIDQTGQKDSVTVKDCQGADPLVSKTATPTYKRAYKWTITKAVDQTTANIFSGTAHFNYTVKVSHDSGTDSGWTVAGKITVSNPNDWESLTVNVTDALPGGTCSVTGGTNVVIAASGSADIPYSCTFTSNPGTGTNKGTATWDAAAAHTSDGSQSGTADFTFADPTTLTDECVAVTDTQYTLVPGTVCVGDANGNPATFTYSKDFPAPALATCETHNNTAKFTTNDTGATGSASQSVSVCANYNALTPGYWKNHLANSKDASYTTACKNAAGNGGSCSNNGPWASQYLPGSPVLKLGGFTVGDIVTAAKVFNTMNCGASTDQGAVGCLAGHLLATKLNIANGSPDPVGSCIDLAVKAADTLLAGVNYSGPSGSYTLTPAQRTQAISIKTTLDNYNNAKGC